MLTALFDADAAAFRSAAACKDESITTALYTVDSMVADALLYCDDGDRYYDKWQLYLTGTGNFRYDIARTAPYKGNRTTPKPEHLPAVRQHLVDKWGAVVADGQEADDAIAIAATTLGVDNVVIIAVDKDFKQIPCHHYNFVKRQHLYQTPEDATKFFYMQILMGDSADNIIGIYGIGPKKAEKMLSECTTEKEMYQVCLDAFDGNAERVSENGNLLFLRRKENQVWTPPIN